MDSISIELAEEREGDMSSLVVGFFVGMRKRAASAQGKTTPGLKVSSDKPSKWSGLDEEAQKSSIVIIMDSPERASDALPALEGPPRMLPRRLVNRWRMGL